MIKVSDVYSYLNEKAPFRTALSYDNVGVLIGSMQRELKTVLVCLDVTEAVVKEALSLKVELIISHHPIIFQGLKQIPEGSLPELLIQNKLTVLSAHTNLDMAETGVNFWLARTCGLDIDTLRRIPAEPDSQADGFGLAGNLKTPMSGKDFAQMVKKQLGAASVKFTDTEKEIRTAAVSCGAGGFILDEVIAEEIDAFVTAELKHHELIFAKAAGLCAIDAGHFETEHLLVKPLTEELQAQFPSVCFHSSEWEQNPASYL